MSGNISFVCFFFYCYGNHRDLHSFPTRRSSDLRRWVISDRSRPVQRSPAEPTDEHPRSEEHTSELQSQFHLVCRLLLEKKKTRLLTSIRSPHTTITLLSNINPQKLMLRMTKTIH